jgi:hypothetical protein
MIICSLQPAVDRELALRNFSPAGPLGTLRRWRTGKLLGISDIYIPYRLYRVQVEDIRTRSARFLAVDAMSGALDPYEFPEPPLPGKSVEVVTSNSLPVRLAEDETRAFVLEKLRRLLFSNGFFRLAKPVMTAEMMSTTFYIPYWAGFYGGPRNVRVQVLNAVRGTIEGSKVSSLVKAWLLEQSGDGLRDAAAPQ